MAVSSLLRSRWSLVTRVSPAVNAAPWTSQKRFAAKKGAKKVTNEGTFPLSKFQVARIRIALQ